MIERGIANRGDLDDMAIQLARYASKIRSKIASTPEGEPFSDTASQGIIIGLLCDALSHGSGMTVADHDPIVLLDDASIRDVLVDLAISKVNATQILAMVVHEMQDVAEYLRTIDPRQIITDGAITSSIGDGISNLYERFLDKYAPVERRARGVFYTPAPIARFIVRLVDDLLKVELGFDDGLADSSIRALDPATGTGTFLMQVLDLVEKTGRNDPPELRGIDLMPVSLAIARVRWKLHVGRSRNLNKPERIVILDRGNVLDMDPARLSGISVVLGNPPYARASQNKGTRVDALMNTYKEGVRGDRNIQALSDDYVKFIRLGQDIINRNGFGIMAYVVNHTFLRGPIFRGMRRSLMASFNKIYILDLHGNAKIQEDVPPGIIDQNMFPIQQGTCIIAAVKDPRGLKGDVTLHHHDLFGTRQEKHAWLEAKGLRGIPWCKIHRPREPLVAFVPDKEDARVLAEYARFPSTSNIFIFNSVGGKPGDDDLLVSLDPRDAMHKISAFVQESPAHFERLVTEAKRKIMDHRHSLVIDANHIIPYNYRPFDSRYAFYHEHAWTRPVLNARQHCYPGNLLLLTTKLVKDREFNHAFISRTFTDVIFLSNTSSTNCYLFPVRVIAPAGGTTWNLSEGYQAYVDRMGLPLDEADLPGAVGYIYALLWSSVFKERYGSCLKDGAPRVPLIEDKIIYRMLRAFGKDLVTLHLLDIPGGQIDPSCNIAGTGLDIVEKMPAGRFIDGRLHINPRRYFHPVLESSCKFRVGKYAVLQKWLDGRVGIALNASDIRHVQAMVHAIDRSIDIIIEIDRIIKERGVIDPR